MKREDYQMVKEIFHSALDVAALERPRFLDEKCSGNPVLRREVERLLDSYDSGYLEQPALERMAQAVAADRLKTGQEIGHYKIIKKIGAGGMGEVFLAEDLRLHRKIALKVLPDSLAFDNERLRRFKQEAFAASALNHPNILTIYEFGDEDGTHFLASEYVEGETLREKMNSGELDLIQSLNICEQIAFALSVAHAGGIAHRDLKPENVMVRADGLVKVLDFGLAKLIENKSGTVSSEDKTVTQLDTMPGMVMGTPSYMSPEQARGKQVDARSDIWSLGVVLYEMLAGSLPFKGENEVDVIASILHTAPPPLSQFVGDVPRELEFLVSKTLQTDRDERYQTVKDLLADLKAVNNKLDMKAITGDSVFRVTDGSERTHTTDGSLNHPTAALQPPSISRMLSSQFKQHPKRLMFTLAVIASVLTAAGFGLYKLTGRQPETFQNMRLAKLTSTGNVVVGQIAISPDGKYIAYAIDENGRQSLWVKQTAAPSNMQIVPPGEVEFQNLSFSPDGNFVYYGVLGKNYLQTIYNIPVFGGNARKLIADVAGAVSFSPDDSRIVFTRDNKSLMIANSDGSEDRTLADASEGERWVRLAWSPDGNKIIGAVYSDTDAYMHLVEVSVSGGAKKTLASPPWLLVAGLGWLADGSGIMVSGRDLETQILQLWLVSYPSGEPRRITNDLNSYSGLSLTADGKTLVSVQGNRLANIWTAFDGETNPDRRVTSEIGKDEGMSGLAWTPDGRIVYTAKVRGRQDLWIVNEDGGNNQQLTFNVKSNFSPTVSPDGRYIVFVSDRDGKIDLWRTDLDGGNPFQLTNDLNIETDPVLSPDGKWVVYGYSDAGNKMTVWKISIDGGNPVQLTDKVSGRPTVSPDGKFIACFYGENPSFKIAVIPFEGGLPTKLIDLPLVVNSRNIRWTPDGKGLIYIDSRDGVFNLWSQPLDGGAPKQLTDFKSDMIFRFDLLPGGKELTLSRGSQSSDVVMINNFR